MSKKNYGGRTTFAQNQRVLAGKLVVVASAEAYAAFVVHGRERHDDIGVFVFLMEKHPFPFWRRMTDDKEPHNSAPKAEPKKKRWTQSVHTEKRIYKYSVSLVSLNPIGNAHTRAHLLKPPASQDDGLVNNIIDVEHGVLVRSATVQPQI